MPNSTKIILIEVLRQKKVELAPDLTDDEFFGLFSCEQILKDYDISYDQIKSGIVDGGGDGGIDAVYTFINGELLEEDTEYLYLKKEINIDLFIIQSKNQESYKEEAINKLHASAIDLFDLSKELDTLKSTYNSELLFKIDLFRTAFLTLASKFPKLNIYYYYSTLGDKPDQKVERKVSVLEKVIKSGFSDCNFIFTFLNSDTLLLLARKQPVITKSLNIEETPISTKDGGFIVLVNLFNYYKFIVDDNDKILKSIFDANVRDYQGKVEVNKAIKDSLQNNFNEDFWWLNNGVTITSNKTVLSGKALQIEEPQIVNGLQTSYEIYNYFHSEISNKADRKILIRILKPENETSRLKIIKATNSQTNIPIASLRATDEIHLNIEDYFLSKGFFYDRRKNYYKNLEKPIDKIISIPYLAQIMTAILLKEPDYSRARPSSLIKSEEKYKMIFDNSISPELYLKSVILQKRVESILKNFQPLLTKNEIGDLKFHLTMSIIIKYLKKTNYTIKDFSNINIESISDSDIKDVLNILKQIYLDLGNTNKVAKSPEFVKKIIETLINI
ncbi:MAG: hypothetical protein EPN82_03305 [Bacteroidetes bacterium]|nr:MAG: hypothetical protein EPN82_03305 [Bacteroidota bacterium]